MATKSCDQAAPNFPSAQNNLEISQQSMSPSMYKHYQTYMQSQQTFKQDLMQSMATMIAEQWEKIFLVAKTTRPPPDTQANMQVTTPKGGTEPKGGDLYLHHPSS